MDKAALRRAMRAGRALLDPALGVGLAAHLAAADLVRPGDVVAGFWPLTGEIDIRPALFAFAARGHVIGLPVTPAGPAPLRFRRWDPGAVLRPGRFGTWEPSGPFVVPGVVLLPLLAFDRHGGRLGYGGGFYDRTLAELPSNVRAIGCGFATQEVDRVPTEPHDRPMHAVATEAGVIFVE